MVGACHGGGLCLPRLGVFHHFGGGCKGGWSFSPPKGVGCVGFFNPKGGFWSILVKSGSARGPISVNFGPQSQPVWAPGRPIFPDFGHFLGAETPDFGQTWTADSAHFGRHRGAKMDEGFACMGIVPNPQMGGGGVLRLGGGLFSPLRGGFIFHHR